MKIVFMGTPDFAVASLNALVDAGYDVQAVVTQPDRPKGRGKKLAYPEVKTRALELNLPVYQPLKVKDPEFIGQLKEYAPDLIVVVAYGRILPKEILEMPKYGCINVHGSLLPEYRGAAPIQRSVLEGRKESGVTIMQMDEGMDTGDMLRQGSLPITMEDTSGTMFEKLAVLGGNLLVETLKDLEAGKVNPIKQDESKATYAARILKEDESIDWNHSAADINCQIRALAPAPGAYTIWNEQRVKLWESAPVDETSDEQPGTVLEIGKHSFKVQTGNGVLEVKQVQPAGKKAMEAKAFCNGSGLKKGDRF